MSKHSTFKSESRGTLYGHPVVEDPNVDRPTFVEWVQPSLFEGLVDEWANDPDPVRQVVAVDLSRDEAFGPGALAKMQAVAGG